MVGYQHYQRTLLGTRVLGELKYTTYRHRIPSCSLAGFWAMYLLYLKHFQELPIPQIMSKILMYIGCYLSQLAPTFFHYLRGFINLYWACNVPLSAFLFFHFFKLMHNGKNNKRISISHRDQKKNACVAFLPSNYAKWQEDFFLSTSPIFLGAESHGQLEMR